MHNFLRALISISETMLSTTLNVSVKWWAHSLMDLSLGLYKSSQNRTEMKKFSNQFLSLRFPVNLKSKYSRPIMTNSNINGPMISSKA